MVENEILIDFGGATRQVDLAVEILGIPPGPNEWLIAAEVLNEGKVLTPNHVNWFYSDAVDRSFVYVPDDYRGGLLKVKGLVTSVDFNRVRLSITSVPWAKHGLAANEYPQLTRCRYAASRVLMELQNAAVEPIHLLGEINR